jgi:hypothetical protein
MKEDNHLKSIPSPIIDIISLTIAKEAGCCPATSEKAAQKTTQCAESHRSGCMVCGAELSYSETNRYNSCHFCGQRKKVNGSCSKGHFICDHCHSADALQVIKNVCLHNQQADLVALMQTIRSHAHFGIHGPEHHSMVPAVILTALRNSGQLIADEQIVTAIERGQTIGGGSCAFLGACGAAIGVGIAASVVLKANPYDGDKRQIVQRVTQTVLGRIASYNAPRCCQRDSWLALKEASMLMQQHTGKSLAANPFACEQFMQNKECIHEQCPLWPSSE